MIDQVGCQKKAGAYECGNHAYAVFPDFVIPDEVIARKEAECAGSVQECIEQGEVVYAHGKVQRNTRSSTIASINDGRYISDAKKSFLAAPLVRCMRRRTAKRRNPAPSIAAETP